MQGGEALIVSLHATYASAKGTDGLNSVIPTLEATLSDATIRSWNLNEYIVIRTCNRFELYASTKDNVSLRSSFESAIKETFPYDQRRMIYMLEDSESVRHLFQVVCGMDSLIIGENEIQSQIKKAYAQAKENGKAGRVLSKLFDRALSVGKKVRSQTALNRGAISVASAAVELASEKLGTLKKKNVTILGAGDTATAIAKNLIGGSVNTIFVSNRNFERATELSEALGGIAVPMSRRLDAMAHSDLILVATSAPHEVVRREHIEEIMNRRSDQPLLIIDVSLPRNVSEDVKHVQNVELDTMDSLERIAMENANRRRKEIRNAERILEDELAKIEQERREEEADEVIRRICLKISEIRALEIEAAKNKLCNNGADEVLEDMSRALANKITADVYKNLRAASRNGQKNICKTAAKLFGV